MDFDAYLRIVKDILNVDKKYVIPRFQREYSWGEEELETLWKDIIGNIKINHGKVESSDYFIGSLVLAGLDSSETLQVVDGQQRLTSITIFLRVLTEIFDELEEINLANGTYKYIEGKDDDDNSYFKLQNETSSEYLNFAIQSRKREGERSTKSEEEEKLKFAYTYFKEKLKEKNLKTEIKNNGEILKYVDLLKGIRGQVLKFKVIYITVSEIDEAYMIFETLNAKGKDLDSIDLIKNKIFQYVKENSVDYAKERWNSITKKLCEREYKSSMKMFYRHFWIGKYSNATEAKLYEQFNKKIIMNEESYKNFLNELENSSEYYKKIVSPNETDWRRQEERKIYNSLKFFRDFNIKSVRIALLVLMEKKDKGYIKEEVFFDIIEFLEKFLYIYIVITSSKSSVLENKFSKFARKLNKSLTKNKSKEIINEFKEELLLIKPSYSQFYDKFKQLYFTNEKDKDKKVIRYTLKKIEKHYHKTDEFSVNDISIEHILPQSENKEYLGYIGNLIILDNKVNGKLDNLDFEKKVKLLEESELLSVKLFLEKNGGKSKWTEKDIITRGDELAELSYNSVWKI